MEKTKNINLSNEIYNDLKNKIEIFEYKPNERISETHLAQVYNVSRTPIKNCLTRLENEGIVYIKPQIGTFVSKIDINHIHEFFTIRYLLEIAIIDDVKENIKSKELAQLKVNLKTQLALLEEFSGYDSIELSKKFWHLDNEFHELIFKSIDKKFIWEYILSQSLQFNRFRVLSASGDYDYFNEKVQDHKKILEYITENSISNIKDIYSNHLFKSLEKIIRELKVKYPDYFE